jgi:ABC-type dipeptide/oligopeptide/nickel transport system permease subunit
MSIAVAAESTRRPLQVSKLQSNAGLAQRRRRWSLSAGISLLLLLGIVTATLGAPWIAPIDPTQQTLLDRLHPPSARYWLGADHLGRDLLARLLYGGRSSLLLAAVAVLVTATVGVVIGAATARVGGFLDEVTMRLVDLLIVFPHLVLALVIATLLTPSFGALLLALTITGWTTYARLARALTLDLLARPFIDAAWAVGVPEGRLLVRHILPNILGPILAMTFLRFGHTLLTVAGLSYLGVGIQPPTPDWGAMIAEAQPYMQRMPLLLIAPAFLIFLTSLAVTLLGQRLADHFDPHRQ